MNYAGEAEVQIRITDTNDNGPYFRERVYSARVPENTESGSVIIVVTAEDRDEENRLTYSITGGNIGGAFEVMPEPGEIKVRASLDYEAGPRVSIDCDSLGIIYAPGKLRNFF